MENIISILQDFKTKPGRMSLEDLNKVLVFYTEKLWFIEAEIIAEHGELTEYNKIGEYNQTTVAIEKAEWYIDYVENKS